MTDDSEDMFLRANSEEMDQKDLFRFSTMKPKKNGEHTGFSVENLENTKVDTTMDQKDLI